MSSGNIRIKPKIIAEAAAAAAVVLSIIVAATVILVRKNAKGTGLFLALYPTILNPVTGTCAASSSQYQF